MSIFYRILTLLGVLSLLVVSPKSEVYALDEPSLVSSFLVAQNETDPAETTEAMESTDTSEEEKEKKKKKKKDDSEKASQTDDLVEEPKKGNEKETSKKKEKKFKKKLSWEGNLKFNFRYAKIRDRGVENKGGFEIGSINIKAKYQLLEALELRGWYQIDPVESELKEAFARLEEDTAIFNLIQMGLQKRLFHLESDLETDSLNKIAFYKLRDLSILSRIRLNHRWQSLVQFANGGILDTRDISPRRVKKQDVILSDSFDDRQAVGSTSRELILGMEYGVKNLNESLKEFSFLVFGSYRPISDDDVQDYATLSDVAGYTGVHTGNTSYTKYGVNGVLKYEQWRSYSQFISATFRDLTRTLFTTELGYKWNDWLPLLAYSQQLSNLNPKFDNRESFERYRLTLGSRYDWKKNIRIAIEGTHNQERTGGNPIYNDEFIISWIYSF